jgi:UDP-N-acetylmuramate dehydrogenase
VTNPLAGVPLAPLCTLELGGAAAWLVEAGGDAEVIDALRWARDAGHPVTILGGGSNVVIADAGVPGLVLRVVPRGLELDRASGRVTVAAGEPWDDVVSASVEASLAGLECLAGIPGLAGATPIQNVGAYGQEVAETIVSVRVLDRRTLEVTELPGADCDFSYRDSRFKREPARFVVLAVTFQLRPGGAPTVRYAELTRVLEERASSRASLGVVRETVIALRRAKSMVIDPADENRRSVGSFFTNPIVPADEAALVLARAADLGAGDVPRWDVPGDHVKLAAGWLIERSGIHKGDRHGPVGISTRHALSLVHHGQGTTAALVTLARHVRTRVHTTFGLTLTPEPTFLGFPTPPM